MQLFQKAWRYLGERNKAGDGVIENLSKYVKVGLKLSHYNARYQGFGTGKKTVNSNILNLKTVPFSKLQKYDSSVFGFNREKFLKLWVRQPKSYSLGYMKDGNLKGYGVLRKCFIGYKIGPLFADDSQVANDLFDALIGKVGTKSKVFFDIPEVNKEALKIVRRHKMKKIFATGRIYSKGKPDFPLDKWYGITTFELG